MFIDKIDEQLLEEIKVELEQEFSDIVASWDEEFVDLNYEDFEDKLRSEIFEHYHHIPLYKLEEIINIYFPFIIEKDIAIEPFSKIVISENGEDYNEVIINVFVDVYETDREKLSEFECKKLDKLLEELTQLYTDVFEIKDTLFIRHVKIENVPIEYYHPDSVNGEHDFVQIEF